MAQCMKCGFVAARDFLTRTMLEVDEGFRKHADRGHGPSGKVLYFERPICAAMAFNLSEEATDTSERQTLAVLSRERECDSFTPWQQEFTPKEHLEMKMLQQQKEWQLEQERKADERHKESLQVVISATNQTLRAALLATLLGAVVTLGAVYLTKIIDSPDPG